MATIHAVHGDLAVLRLDASPGLPGCFLTVFRTVSGWRVVGEHQSGPTTDPRDSPEHSADNYAETLAALQVYYDAVETGRAGALEAILTPDWRMRNLSRACELREEDRDAFARQIDGKPLDGYASDRHVADIQWIRACLACVRIDKPSTGAVTFFTFRRLDGRWKICEKAWSDGVGE